MFSETLNKLLELKHIKQSKLANYLSISESQLSRYCAGTSEPNYSLIAKISGFFEISPKIFFEEPGDVSGFTDLAFVDGTIYQIVSVNINDGIAIINARYTQSKNLNTRLGMIILKHKLKVVVNLIEGEFFIDKKKCELEILKSFNKVEIKKDSIIQIILMGDITSFFADFKTQFKSNSLI